ncbi:MAG TPA: ABC transporter permease [Rhodothermales bacterium]|nr:ABC transporter permease [Rhodothermales bacterium]HRR08295.1 ABC transporter permease [Rhodothermales bacterium]
MNLLKLSLSYIRRQKLTTLLNTFLLGIGIATIILLLLFSAQFGEKMERDAKGIDMVVGAKGSPLQLILSGIYHLDVPTGNIPLSEVEKLRANRMVKEVIPLSLGDSYNQFRIVGTTEAYPAHYEAKVASGKMFNGTSEATIGAQVAKETGLKVGDTFVGAHGLVEGGEGHHQHPYKVVGVLAPTNTVMDRLILTSLASVWDVHGLPHSEANKPEDEHHSDEAHDHEEETTAKPDSTANVTEAIKPLPVPPITGPPAVMGGALPSGAIAESGPEVTVALVKFASPIATVMLPRSINSQTKLQAATPAQQLANLLQLVGVGISTIRVFGFILMFAALLGVFIALYNAIQERRYDLAMMRALGASREKIFLHVLLEGLIYAIMGVIVGLLLGHGITEIIGQVLSSANQVELTGLRFVPGEVWVILAALATGVIAALIPAFQAYRTDIAQTLAD